MTKSLQDLYTIKMKFHYDIVIDNSINIPHLHLYRNYTPINIPQLHLYRNYNPINIPQLHL